MLYKEMDFHNAAHVEETSLGSLAYRFPKDISDRMGEGSHTYGRYVSRTTTGCELRFVLEDGDRALLFLSALDEEGYVQVYRGDFRYYTGYTYSYPVSKGKVTAIPLIKSPGFESLESNYKKGSFSPDVWRIMFDINCTLAFNGLETYGGKVRPPRTEEVPRKTLLAYGTSLTYGACATAQSLSYIQLLGRFLKCNILNKAMGGSCMNEKGVADYFALEAGSFDAVLLENAVNMGSMPQVYEKNMTYLMDRLVPAMAGKPIYLITAYPNSSNIGGDKSSPCVKKSGEKGFPQDELMRELASRYPGVAVIEGDSLLEDFTGLTCDLIHLSDYGHIEVARKLSERIRF